MMGSNARLPFDPVWLFPVTYAAHMIEEYFVGGGFPVWAERALAIQLSNREFVAWNTFAFLLICLGALLVSRYPRLRWIEISIAIAVLGNAAAHIVGSLATWTYSPGLLTSVFVWSPFGCLRLQTVSRGSSRRARFVGTWVGVLVTIAILAVLTLEGCGIGAFTIRSHVTRSPVTEHISRTAALQPAVSASVQTAGTCLARRSQSDSVLRRQF
jgi:hypothetical protein